jgi:hypothetical protein
MMIRLLSASALAVILMAPAAQAAHRYHHGSFAGYRHYPVARFSAAPHRFSYRRYWTGARTARGEDFGSRREAPGSWHRETGQDFAEHRTFQQTRVSGGRPRAWCGWYARSLVGQDPGPEYNLARNWTHWGRPASPGVGVMVVWPHHVGMITGRSADGQWIVKSGNDGGGVARERPRSVSGAIAFRAG